MKIYKALEFSSNQALISSTLFQSVLINAAITSTPSLLV